MAWGRTQPTGCAPQKDRLAAQLPWPPACRVPRVARPGAPVVFEMSATRSYVLCMCMCVCVCQVCAYAINQHDVLTETSWRRPSVEASAPASAVAGQTNAWAEWRDEFMQAIEHAEKRVVLVLDRRGYTCKRAWCVLEMYAGIEETLEIYAATTTSGGRRYDMSQLDAIKTAVGREGLRGSRWREARAREEIRTPVRMHVLSLSADSCAHRMFCRSCMSGYQSALISSPSD